MERLAERTQYGGTVTERLTFIVEKSADADAELKDRLLRLRPPRSEGTPQIWNTPAPPDPAACLFHTVPNTTWQRLHAADLDRIYGVTFLLAGGQLYGIHIHRSGDSCAKDTCERFSNRRRLRTVWLYLPIAPEDQVAVLGTRKIDSGLNILVRTRLSGDVILGCLGRRFDRDCLLGKGQITLVYGEPEELEPVSVFGASCTLPVKKSSFPRPFPLQDFQPEPAGAYFSWAPLSGVLSARTFYEEDAGLCRGIVLCYENGGSRAVGQCRLHVDHSILVTRPTRLCFQATTYLTRLRKRERRGVRVEFGRDGDDPHRDGEEWQCLSLGGVLQFSFTEDSSYVSVVEHFAEE